jgi:Co/Zn/Cd efflux system component
MGDFLGSVGVVISALIIKYTDWPGKLYADPIMGCIIAVFILNSAYPLLIESASNLMQGSPFKVHD